MNDLGVEIKVGKCFDFVFI